MNELIPHKWDAAFRRAVLLDIEEGAPTRRASSGYLNALVKHGFVTRNEAGTALTLTPKGTAVVFDQTSDPPTTRVHHNYASRSRGGPL